MSRLRSQFEAYWWRIALQARLKYPPDILIAGVLRVGAWVYGAVVRVRNYLFDQGLCKSTDLPCAVISIGNLSVGGTGKTPAVIWLARRLASHRRNVAILSRGYGSRLGQYIVRSQQGSLTCSTRSPQRTPNACAQAADEPLLLAQSLDSVPVLVGRRRSDTGRMACEQFATDTLVLDDGFQHRALERDCDIVLINARQPLQQALLPRGLLREPMSSLKRAHILIITQSDQAPEQAKVIQETLQTRFAHLSIALAVHQPQSIWDPLANSAQPLDTLDQKRVGLLSSIADPQAFESAVRHLGARVVWHRRYADHHRYSDSDVESINKHIQQQPVQAVLTTEKDWMRLQWKLKDIPVNAVPLWLLKIDFVITEGEKELDARLNRLCVR